VGRRAGLDSVEKRRMMELYLHSPICLHGTVLNLLSTGTTLPFIGEEVVLITDCDF
jgi:hypothetical protein